MKDVRTRTPSQSLLVLLPATSRPVSTADAWPPHLAASLSPRAQTSLTPRMRALRRRLGLEARPVSAFAECVFTLLILSSVAALWFSRT